MTDSNNVMNEIQLVVFDLASEHYGVDITHVREIMRMQTVTRVPGVIDCMEGVINLRGKVLPVLDLRKRLELKAADHTQESRIVVVDIATGEVGVIVDAVTEVLRVPNSAIDSPSAMMSHGDSEYLRGIAKLSDRLIILLDLHELLSPKAIRSALKQVAENTVPVESTEKEAAGSGNGPKKKADEPVKKNGSREHATA